LLDSLLQEIFLMLLHLIVVKIERRFL